LAAQHQRRGQFCEAMHQPRMGARNRTDKSFAVGVACSPLRNGAV
jgi:hypothetical protein